MKDEDTVEIPVAVVDEEFHGKKVFVLHPDPQKHSRKQMWLNIFQTDEMKNPLHAAWQKHEHKMMESLKSNKYQYGVGTMTVAAPVPGRFSAVKVDDKLDHKRTHLFLKINFSLATVDDRQRSFCIQKLVDFASLGLKSASQLTGMTHIRAPGSQPLTTYELLRLSQSANVITRLVLQNTSPIDVIESLVQYSETFESNYKA